jgi:hypothetical protein
MIMAVNLARTTPSGPEAAAFAWMVLPKAPWPPLSGGCWASRFEARQEAAPLALELELYGVETDSEVEVNGQPATTLPIQPSYRPGQRPNWWSERVTVPLEGAELRDGWNTITICAGRLSSGPELDDLQMRNIRVVAW